MTTKKLLKSNAYTEQGTPDLPDHPALKGSNCQCGHVYFPRQHFGCESCGNTGEVVENVLMSGKGTLHSFAKVHRSAIKKYPAPYFIGSVLLDRGCVIRAILNVKDESQLKIGQTVYSELVKIDKNENNEEVFDLRFTI